MAGNIKGIKIEIDGDTQPLQKALKNVNKAATDASQELKQIDKALKFDTGNVTLLTQKQEVLQKQVATTKEKLETLRQAQSQVEQQFKNGNIGADQYRAFQREVEVTQNVLKGYEGKLASVNQALAENGSATQNNKNQLKELQNEQKQLASENERVVSSFKLQESQLGANASEADKLALAEKRIGAQSDIVARQIENLEKPVSYTHLGKTSFTAAIALAYQILDTDSGSKCYIVANSVKQAMEAFGFLKFNVERWNDKNIRIKDNNQEHSITANFGNEGSFFIQALANDESRLDSLNGNVIILDEAHTMRNSKKYGLMKKTMSAYRNSMLFVISTAGDIPTGFLANRLKYCQKVLKQLVKDDSLFMFICKADQTTDGDVGDYLDENVLKKANPSWGCLLYTSCEG